MVLSVIQYPGQPRDGNLHLFSCPGELVWTLKKKLLLQSIDQHLGLETPTFNPHFPLPHFRSEVTNSDASKAAAENED